MVPGTGLEPAWITPLAPKASASTNFATRAYTFITIMSEKQTWCRGRESNPHDLAIDRF